jgi:hypothetical protein
LKFLFITFVVVVLAGKFFTGSYLWEQDLSAKIRELIPVSPCSVVGVNRGSRRKSTET